MSNLEQLKGKTKKSLDRIKFKDVTQALKEEKHGFSQHLFWFVFLTIISLCIAYLVPFSLILTIPLVIIPSWFAFTSVNALKGVKNAGEIKFFIMFRNYFSQFFFGGYRLLFGLLKGFIAYFISNFVGFLIFDWTILSKNADYQALIGKLTSVEEINGISEELIEFMSKPELRKPMFLLTAISLMLGCLVFIHHVLKHSVKMRRNLFSKSPIPMRQFYPIDKVVRKSNRKFIISSYFATTWFIQLIVILSAIGGIILSYFLLNSFDEGQAVVISLFIMFVLLIPLYNYISVVQTFLYLELAGRYEQTFVNMTLEFLNKYKEKIGIEESEAQKIQEILEAQKRENEEKEKEKANLEDK